MTVVFVFSFELSPTSGRFAQPTDLIVEADGHILVADSGLKAVVRIDPISGERTIVSDASTGSGPGFATPFSLAIEANGQIVVTDVGMRAVLRVDAQSGDRAIISR
jgi:streptogramin lyase